MPAFRLLLTASLALPLSIYAQQGNRKGHDNMDSIVPKELIPEAPVLPVDKALQSFELASGFVIEPVAVEPLVKKPVTLKFDGDGRMWVVEMSGYMPDIDGNGEDKPTGCISILDDTDGDGVVDKRTVFLDKIVLPRAIYILDDGILWADQNSLYFTSREGDKPSGEAEVVDKDYSKGGNVEHKANGLLYNLDNWIYNAKSDRRYKRINGKWVMEKTHFRGQWGIDKDDYGRLYHNTNSLLLSGDFLMPNTIYGNDGAKTKGSMNSRIGSNAVWPIRVTPGVNRGYINELNGYGSNTISPKTFKLINATGASGMEIYRGDQFPDSMYGTAFVTEPCGNLVKAITIKDGKGKLEGSHPYGEKEFLASTDERFRPVDAVTAPDGSLYIIDFYHGIIQHKTYVTTYLRNQYASRGLDKPGNDLGRIYRVKAKGKSLGERPRMQSLKAQELVPFLTHSNGWWRDTAQRLIVERGDASLLGDLQKVLANKAKPLSQLHALWCLEGLGIMTAEHVAFLVESGDEHLASSALYAACSLPDLEKQKLLSSLDGFKPADVSSIYLARFLGSVGTVKAFDALIELLNKHGKDRLVRLAAFTGLKGHEGRFLEHNKDSYKEKELLGWLKSASSQNKSKVPPRKLQGEHLASYKRGEEVYLTKAACAGCHGIDGAGLPNLGPLLDGSDWVTGSTDRLTKVLLHGLTGPITVSGEKFNPAAAMPGLGQNPSITDQDLADVMTYIRQGWDNRASQVKKDAVVKIREATKDRNGAVYTEQDFK